MTNRRYEEAKEAFDREHGRIRKSGLDGKRCVWCNHPALDSSPGQYCKACSDAREEKREQVKE